MDRLTFNGNFCDITMCAEMPCKYPDGGCSQKQVWERLKAFEDAEEQELLVKLPCKIGTTIHYVQYICEYKKCDTNTRMSCCGCFNYMENRYVIGTRDFALSDIGDVGRTIFLTHEEAKERLKEIEEKNG